MTGTSIIGIHMLRTGKLLDRSVKDMAEEAVRGALKDAGIEPPEVQAIWFSNTRQALMEGQNSIRGQAALRDLGFHGAGINNVENACASSSTGLWNAVNAIRSGTCEVALVVGSEKMIYPDVDKETVFKTFMGGTDIHRMDEARAFFRQLAGELGDGATAEGGTHTFFMDMYAALAKHHMRTFGTTQEQIGAAAAKNHAHSVMNPLAQYQHAMTLDEVLADRAITFPLTRAMCAPISDGAAALVVASDDWVRRHGRGRAVGLRGIALRSGQARDVEDYDGHIGRLTALDAYDAAGISASEVNVVELHDATSFGEIMQIENLGIVPRGQGGPATLAGDTALGGRVPVNPSGGLVSKGHPIAATGIIQLHELVTQLRGEAGPRQIDGARIAVAENGGGFVGVEDAACVVTVLEAPQKG
ncbi:thiolase family protein [Mameliella sediminis]|uniref:thiolase family protein n=1 Tax=Mameliella sediminis TaxID=2836866 RepID=UPI001C487A50|nr:thiolase family protein [Mameliella sediminis]MBV7392649.1 thiolase family protein [Mameliella sediminis]